MKKTQDLQNKLDGTTAPGTGNDSSQGYAVLSRWADVVANKAYVCVDASVGAAIWIETTQSGAGGTVTGSGTPNYVSKWTSTTAQGDSQLQDDGTTMSAGAAPIATSYLYLLTSTIASVITADNNGTAAYNAGYTGNIQGAGTSNFGMDLEVNSATGENVGIRLTVGYAGTAAVNAGTDTGIAVEVASTSSPNIGGQFKATGVSGAKNLGGYFEAANGTSNYAIQLVDGNEAAGKFLKCFDNLGNAVWDTIPPATDTNFAEDNLTFDANRDHNTAGFDLRIYGGGQFAFNNVINVNAAFILRNNAETYGFWSIADGAQSIARAVFGQGISTDASNTENTGGFFAGENGGASTKAWGVKGSACIDGAATAVGVTATGGSFYGGNNTNNLGDSLGVWVGAKQPHANDNYGIVIDTLNGGAGTSYIGIFDDGRTTGSGKFLKSIDVNGTAEWATILSTDISGVTGFSGVSKNSGATVNAANRTVLNFIEGTNVTLTIADDSGGDEVDITIAAEKPTLNKAFILDAPTASDDITFFRTDVDITVQEVIAVSTGTTPSTTFVIKHAPNRSDAGTNVINSLTTTSTAAGNTATLSDSTIPADSWVWIETTAASGTNVILSVDLRYTED